MKSNPNIHRNRSNRHKLFDYSNPGKYFITLNTQDSLKYLGVIENGIILLSKYGNIVKNELLKIPEYHKRIVLDEWIIMPDHIHMIILLREFDFDNGISFLGDGNEKFSLDDDLLGQFHEIDLKQFAPEQFRIYRRNMLIPKIMGKFKMLTSKQINIICNTPGQNNWQSDYYDHIIRNEQECLRIKQYIINNPKNYSCNG
jgi:REP element-mobilizing transposase RayT